MENAQQFRKAGGTGLSTRKQIWLHGSLSDGGVAAMRRRHCKLPYAAVQAGASGGLVSAQTVRCFFRPALQSPHGRWMHASDLIGGGQTRDLAKTRRRGPIGTGRAVACLMAGPGDSSRFIPARDTHGMVLPGNGGTLVDFWWGGPAPVQRMSTLAVHNYSSKQARRLTSINHY